MYRPIASSGANPLSAVTSAFASKGVNKRDLPQLLNTEFAQVIENYLIEGLGRIIKRKGYSVFFDASQSFAITMLEKYTNDIYLFAYNTTVAAYTISTDTITNIKTDFTTSDPFSGTKYGDYFFVCNGGNKIGRISQTLNYDAQTANFTVGDVLTGGTSGATAIILEDSDGGTTGTLTLGSISGTFQDGEIITDPSGGSADADGVVGFTFTEIADAPKAKHVKAIGDRLYAGNIEGNPSEVQYSRVDDGTNPPFTDWTASSAADDAGSVNFRNAGDVNALASIGSQVVVLYDDGKAGFRITTIDSAGTLVQSVPIDFQKIDFGGERGSITTPKGVFYVNEAGVFQLVAGGQTNVPFSDQERQPSLIFGIDFIEGLNFTNGDLVYDNKRNIVMVTCAQDSAVNNLILVYDLDLEVWTTFKGWNVNRFLKDGVEIYGSSSSVAKVFKLFDTETDDGAPITAKYEQEINVGAFMERKSLNGVYFQGKLSLSSSISIKFDIFDINGSPTTDKLTLTWTTSGLTTGISEYGEASWGDAFGGASESSSLIDSFAGSREKISNFQRIILKLETTDTVPHEINLFQALITNKGSIRRRNLT